MEDIVTFAAGRKFATILADPPWRFRTWNETNQRKSASRHYDLMQDNDILSLPVAAVAADDCALFLWAINPMLPHAMRVIDAWGFKYKTVGFTWAKQSTTGRAWHMGLGYWSRQNTEQCLLAVRGHPVRLAKDVPQLIVAPRREHSRKPDQVYERIERLSEGPRLELFGRQERPNWVSWGNETDKFGDSTCTT